MFGYRDLIEKGNYKLILDLTKDSNKVDDLYFRTLALALNEEYEDALRLIDFNRNDFLSMKPSVRKELFTVHMHCLYKTNKVLDLVKELDYYDSLPYEDYEFEEMLKDMKNNLMNNVSFNSNEVRSSNDKLHEIANSLDNYQKYDKTTLLHLIDELRGYDIEDIMSSIRKFLSSDYDDEVRTYMLLVLVSKGTYDEVDFSKNGLDYHLVPYELDPPFDNDYHQELIKILKDLSPNPSILKVANDILSIYTLSIYPENCYEVDQYALSTALIAVASKLLNEQFKLEEYLLKYKLNKEVVNALINDISEANSFKN